MKRAWLFILLLAGSSLMAKRRDMPGTASPMQIAKVLGQVKLVGIFCGDDVDAQICKFFANALQVGLKNRHVSVSLFYQPETLVQSFYVPPMPLPFTDVTLRLIENVSNEGTQVNLGGFCFDSHSQDQSGFQLPRWSEIEAAGDTGPLETDKAAAANKLAKEFAAYWIETIKVTTKH